MVGPQVKQKNTCSCESHNKEETENYYLFFVVYIQMITNIIFRRSDSPITSDKPHYPYELPKGWCWTTLGEICCIKGGKRIPRGMTFAKGKTAHIYIRVTDMKDNTIKLSDLKYIDDYVYEHIKNYTINASDLYLTIAGTIGSVGIVPNEVDGMNLTENAAKLTQIGCIKEYLLYALLSTIAQEHFISRFHQVAQPKLSIETASKTPIAMPPIGEQIRIVKEIKRYLAAIKIIEEGQTDLETTISQTKSKILDLAIHGKLVPQDPTDEPATELLKRINPNAEITSDNGHYQKLPEGWVITPMQILCALVDGEKQNGIERINLDVKFLRGEREAKVLTSGKYTAANTLLILVDGENSGEVFRAPVDGYQGSTFKQLSIHEEMYTDYVLQVINLHRKTLRENKVGSAIPHLNKKLFKAINVPIPPYEEQKRIVNAVSKTFTILDTIAENL